jgi:DNA repair protein RecN (Recombination protein N)
MLHELLVRNLGIIEEVKLVLPPGLVALTGETGAGKSLLVQSLQLLQGERADAEQVRAGCDKLVVQARLSPPVDSPVYRILAEAGIDAGDELVLRREVTASGRSRAWINEAPVTAGTLQRLAPHLLVIHGQHDQRSLADPARHLDLVDAVAGLEEERAAVAHAFAAWEETCGALAAQRRALASRQERLDLIDLRCREIDQARCAEGEDEALRQERAFLRHAERIGELVQAVRSAIGGEGGAVALARAAKAAAELASLGLPTQEAAADLDQARLLTEEAERAIESLASRVRHDPARLEAVEARLALLERLARKYGGSLAAVAAERARLERERAELLAVEDDLQRLAAEEQRRAREFLACAVALSRRRAAAARTVATQVAAVLAKLGMPAVTLRLRLERRWAEDGQLELDGRRLQPAADGIDVGEWLFSANPGEEARPLWRIASGGELSRLHLAMRTVMRERSGAPAGVTLLFDEVDAGIGGLVADELGCLLAEVARRDQVLVVTHLPQVAARASAHLAVSKVSEGGRTVTRVAPVEGEERVAELVRMLGGGPATPAARRHAEELLRLP